MKTSRNFSAALKSPLTKTSVALAISVVASLAGYSVAFGYGGGQAMITAPVVVAPVVAPVVVAPVVTPVITQAPAGRVLGVEIYNFTRNFSAGSRGNDIKSLQQFLIDNNAGKAAQTLARVGSTSYFGPLTRAALAEYQKSVGIKPASGNFGPITRAYLSGLVK
ncbi:MAG: peptidoglycan-binding domain-containing protein [bacterium]